MFFAAAIGIALILLLAALYDIYNKSNENKELTELLNERTIRLKELYELPIFPSTENIRSIENDKRRLLDFIKASEACFKPIVPSNIPNAQVLRTEMDRAVFKWNQAARNAGVAIPPNNYAYSFDELVKRIDFKPYSFRPIATQMAELDKILEILFNAKINRLEFIQRARVCDEDRVATVSANYYIADAPITNAVSIIHPYRIIFRCFSSELAAVMEGFARSPYGFIIKSMDVDPVSPEAPPLMAPPPPGIAPPPSGAPPTPPPMFQPRRPIPGRGATRRELMSALQQQQPQLQPPSPASPYPQPMPVAVLKTNRSGVVTLFNERPFRVSMLVHAVTIRPQQP